MLRDLLHLLYTAKARSASCRYLNIQQRGPYGELSTGHKRRESTKRRPRLREISNKKVPKRTVDIVSMFMAVHIAPGRLNPSNLAFGLFRMIGKTRGGAVRFGSQI